MRVIMVFEMFNYKKVTRDIQKGGSILFWEVDSTFVNEFRAQRIFIYEQRIMFEVTKEYNSQLFYQSSNKYKDFYKYNTFTHLIK